MTIEVTPDKIYFAIALLVLSISCYQYYSISKVKNEINQVWSQMGVLVTTISIKIQELDKKIQDNEKSR
jgi:hypothetical protein